MGSKCRSCAPATIRLLFLPEVWEMACGRHLLHLIKMSEPTQEEKTVKKVINVRNCRHPKLKTSLQDGDRGSPCDPHPDNVDPQPPQEELLTTMRGHAAFADSVYLLASVIFQNHHREKPASRQLVKYGNQRGLLLPHVKDEIRRPAYEMAFNALKYQELLEDIITDSGLFLSHPIPDDQMSLFAVMLYDFQDRKFLPQSHGTEMSIQEVRDVEHYLLRCKTKLEASLARYRIKHEVSSVESILPESVKVKQKRSSRLLLYAWINTLRSSPDEVKSVLNGAGVSRVASMEQLEGQTFCRDPHCDDVLVFPAWMKATLDSTKMLHEHKLILQDKSCCLTPNAVISLLPDDGDVLMVGRFSGLTVSHTASLIKEKRKTSDKSKVLACVSHLTDVQIEELLQVVANTGCKNVKLIPEVFQSLASADKRLTKVRLILLTPDCSLSAVSNPLEFMLQENRDTNLLQDLCHGSVAQNKLDALIAQQRKDMDHALKFPKVSAVVYSTCSWHPEENEELVTKAVEEAKVTLQSGWQLKTPSLRRNPDSNSPEHAEDPEINDSFFRLEPSEQSNGCFLALLIREGGEQKCDSQALGQTEGRGHEATGNEMVSTVVRGQSESRSKSDGGGSFQENKVDESLEEDEGRVLAAPKEMEDLQRWELTERKGNLRREKKSSQPEATLKGPTQAAPAKGKPDRMRSNQPIRKTPRGQTMKSSKATFSSRPPEHRISIKAQPHLAPAKPLKLRRKVPQNSSSTSSSSSDFKQENSKSHLTNVKKHPSVVTALFNTTTSTSSPRPAPPPVAPRAPAVHPRKVLKPAVIVLPPLRLLPPPPPPPHPGLHTWRTPATTLTTLPSPRLAGSFSKDVTLKHKLRFWV
uniref:putative methyltransferase NSUN7 n=1 Tax=Doryrhamphus excisus TaxID=161450 RepID=UPI0025AE4764|nr:putative methyltransferase NSUN7 [Doryrhamphus excisus]